MNERKRKIIFGKRALVDDMMFWIFRIILILIISFALVFFINSVIKKNLESGKLEITLIASRIIYSPSCLAMSELVEAYSGEQMTRVYPGKIRLSSYNNEHLKEKCVITEGDAKVGAKITISGMPSVYINQEYYEDIEPLTFSSKYQKVRHVYPVLVYEENGKEESKIIEIIVVAKKR